MTVAGLGATLPGGVSSPIELAAEAGRAALIDAGLTPDDVTALTYTGTHSSYTSQSMPVADLIGRKLGLDEAPYVASFDLPADGAGVLSAIVVGGSLLHDTSDVVLVTSADEYSGPYGHGLSVRPGQAVGTALVLRGSRTPATDATASKSREVGIRTDDARRRWVTSREQNLVDNVLRTLPPELPLVVCAPDDVDLPAGAIRVGPRGHTATPILGLLQARAAGHRRVAFVAAGTGQQVSATICELVPHTADPSR
ncbi:MAG: hypothetical protein QM658_07060 [Gordonia sp. (in: high G+C Gram-positive bacteria)]